MFTDRPRPRQVFGLDALLPTTRHPGASGDRVSTRPGNGRNAAVGNAAMTNLEGILLLLDLLGPMLAEGMEDVKQDVLTTVL